MKETGRITKVLDNFSEALRLDVECGKFPRLHTPLWPQLEIKIRKLRNRLLDEEDVTEAHRLIDPDTVGTIGLELTPEPQTHDGWMFFAENGKPTYGLGFFLTDHAAICYLNGTSTMDWEQWRSLGWTLREVTVQEGRYL